MKRIAAILFGTSLAILSLGPLAFATDGAQGTSGPAMKDKATGQLFDSQDPPHVLVVNGQSVTLTGHGTATLTVTATGTHTHTVTDVSGTATYTHTHTVTDVSGAATTETLTNYVPWTSTGTGTANVVTGADPRLTDARPSNSTLYGTNAVVFHVPATTTITGTGTGTGSGSSTATATSTWTSLTTLWWTGTGTGTRTQTDMVAARPVPKTATITTTGTITGTTSGTTTGTGTGTDTKTATGNVDQPGTVTYSSTFTGAGSDDCGGSGCFATCVTSGTATITGTSSVTGVVSSTGTGTQTATSAALADNPTIDILWSAIPKSIKPDADSTRSLGDADKMWSSIWGKELTIGTTHGFGVDSLGQVYTPRINPPTDKSGSLGLYGVMWGDVHSRHFHGGENHEFSVDEDGNVAAPNITATPTAGKIPIADGSATLNAWVSHASGDVATTSTTATPTASKIPIADGSGTLNGWVVGRMIAANVTVLSSSLTSDYGYAWTTVLSSVIDASASGLMAIGQASVQNLDGSGFCQIKLVFDSTDIGGDASAAEFVNTSDRRNLSVPVVHSFAPGSSHTIYLKISATEGERCFIFVGGGSAFASLMVQQFL
jgi:hypothetical protein